MSIESCNTEKLFFDARKYSDGHPTIVHNRYIISDTYPDKNRIKKLFVYDLVKNDYRELGLFYESMSFFLILDVTYIQGSRLIIDFCLLIQFTQGKENYIL